MSVTHEAMTGECAADYAAASGYFEAVAPLSRPAAIAALSRKSRFSPALISLIVIFMPSSGAIA
jgi:hypothetical protein